MLKFPLKNWGHVEKSLFLTKKNCTIYAYAYAEEIYIGTEEEIYRELKFQGYNEIETEDYYNLKIETTSNLSDVATYTQSLFIKYLSDIENAVTYDVPDETGYNNLATALLLIFAPFGLYNLKLNI